MVRRHVTESWQHIAEHMLRGYGTIHPCITPDWWGQSEGSNTARNMLQDMG